MDIKYSRSSVAFLLVTFLFLCACDRSAFVDNSDGTLIDKETKYQWLKLPVNIPPNSNKSAFLNLDSLCTSKDIGGITSWALPSEDEIRSVMTSERNPETGCFINSELLNCKAAGIFFIWTRETKQSTGYSGLMPHNYTKRKVLNLADNNAFWWSSGEFRAQSQQGAICVNRNKH